MGTWGSGAFENDAAADFIAELIESEVVIELVHEALNRVIDANANAYLDIEDGQVCVAACELIALAFGERKAPRKLVALMTELKADPSFVQRALKALPRVFDRTHSELAGVWESAELFDELYERLLTLNKEDSAAPLIDLRALFRAEPAAAVSRSPPQPFDTTPYDVSRMVSSSPALRSTTAAQGKTWVLVINGVLNVYDQLSTDDLEKLQSRPVSQLQFARRFKLTEATLKVIDQLLEKNPNAVLRTTLNGFGAFDDLEVLGRLPHLRKVVLVGSDAFLSEDATRVLERFPHLTHAMVNGVEAGRTK